MHTFQHLKGPKAPLVELTHTHKTKKEPCNFTASFAGSTKLVTFGRGEDGQLGHGTADDQHEPMVVEALKGAHLGSVACGAEYTVAVTKTGDAVYSWGWYDAALPF
jgi:alpha-tubulin suppressor-like RCC1 family protein